MKGPTSVDFMMQKIVFVLNWAYWKILMSCLFRSTGQWKTDKDIIILLRDDMLMMTVCRIKKEQFF